VVYLILIFKMKAIIVAEGRGDLAVLSNILKGSLNIDLNDIKFHTPEYEFDQTDLFNMNEKEFGGWNRVKNTCLNYDDLDIFFQLNENSILIVQIDSAEKNEIGFDVSLPIKSDDNEYCNLVCENISMKIKEWLSFNYENKTAFAICIEEMEAWLLTIYKDNTSKYPNPKEKFDYECNKKLNKKERKILSEHNVFKKYYQLSKPFSKKKELTQYVSKNDSFQIFYDQIIALNS